MVIVGGISKQTVTQNLKPMLQWVKSVLSVSAVRAMIRFKNKDETWKNKFYLSWTTSYILIEKNERKICNQEATPLPLEILLKG